VSSGASDRWRRLAAVAPGLALGCTLTYGDLPIGQCRSDADCTAIGTSLDRCDLEQRVCVTSSELGALAPVASRACELPGAASARDCAAGGCAAPFSADCSCLAGAWGDPDALVLGVLAPETFASFSGPPVRIPHVPRWEQTLALALDEWSRELPGGALLRSRRPHALQDCNTKDELLPARRPMRHQIENARAPVVITLTDNDTESIRYQAQRQGTVVVCSTCFATPPQEPSRAAPVWQIAPPLIDQAPLVAWRVAGALASLGLPDPPAGELPTVVTLSQDYAGINDFRAEVQRLLARDGHYRVVPVQTGDPREGDVAQTAVARAVIAARPRVIVVGMDSDFTTYYLPLLERGWPEGEPRPAYIASYLNQELALLADVVGPDEGLRARISGAGWWSEPGVSATRAALEQRFLASSDQHLDQTQFGYDGFYAAAYATAWADAQGSTDGSTIALGFDHLLEGPALEVGPSNIRSALAQLSSGQDIRLTGSSSSLEWQASSRIPRSDVSLWCLARGATGQLELTVAGPIWRAASGEISGRYSCP
jgi:hypothetical protein